MFLSSPFFCFWLSPLFFLILRLVFCKLVWFLLLCIPDLLSELPSQTFISSVDVSPGFSSGNSNLYKIQLKSNCRVKIYFWFCNSIIGNTDHIETPFIHLSTVWPCFSLLFCSSKQWIWTCLSLCLDCASSGNCMTPCLKFRYH